MTKILKFTIVFILTLVLIAIIAMVSLAMFVSPNRFKPVIVEQVMKKTGRELTIDGDLSWTFFPSVGLKTGHVLLSNPAGFTPKTFVEIQNATIGVQLLPLLQGSIRSSGITLNGMKLNLIRNANGKTNWTFDQQATAPVSPTTKNSTTAKTTPVATPVNTSRAAIGLTISGVDVSDATITWRDDQAKKFITIDKFGLHAQDINLNEPFPIKSDFDFTSKDPAVAGHIALTSKITFNYAKQLYAFRDLEFTANVLQNNNKIKMSINADTIVDLTQQTLKLSNVVGRVENLTLNGKVDVVNLMSSPSATGHFIIVPFDLKQWLQNIGQKVEQLQTVKNVAGNLDFTASQNAVTAQGSVKIDEMQANNVKLTNLVVPFNFQNNILNFAPVTAVFYKGDLQSQAKVNLGSATPQISVQAKLANFQMQPLWEDLAGTKSKVKMTGAGHFDIQVTTSGADANPILKNLNGTSHLNITNGVLQGVDIGHAIDSAYALMKKQTAPEGVGSNQTTFSTFSGSAVIKNGVIHSEDLLIDSPRFKTKGQGQIDLVNKQINYNLQTALRRESQESKTQGFVIPILVTGNLTDPSIRLDTAALLKNIAQQQLEAVKQKAHEQIQQKIKDKLSGDAGKMLQNFLGQGKGQ